MTQASMQTLLFDEEIVLLVLFWWSQWVTKHFITSKAAGVKRTQLCSAMATVVPREGQVPEGFETGCILFSAFCTYMIFGNVAFRQPPIKNIFKEVPWKIVMENMRIF